MTDLFLRPLPPQRRRPEMNFAQPDAVESSAHVDVPSAKPRQRRPVPRIASLDILSAVRMGGSACPSIKSDGSQSSSHRMLLSSGESTETFCYQDRDQTEAPMSLDRMVDALHYIMMTKPVLDPVPREYNSYILHLLEGYWNAQEQLKKSEEALAEEKETKQRSLEEFTKMSEEWQEKEAGFRAEIKRMELVLTKVAPEGVGAVVLARSESVVDRSARSSRLFKARIQKARASPEKDGHEPDKTDSLENSRVTGDSDSPRQTHRTFLSMQPNLDDNADVELSQELRKIQRRRHRTIRNGKQDLPPSPTDIIRALDTSSSEDSTLTTVQRATDPSARPQAPGLPRRVSRMHMQNTRASHVPKLDIDISQRYGDVSNLSDPMSRKTSGVNSAWCRGGDADKTADQMSSAVHPDVMTAAFGRYTKPSARELSESHRHKRQFSFNPGEDGIPLQTFAGRVHYVSGQYAYTRSAESPAAKYTRSSERSTSSSSSEQDPPVQHSRLPCGDAHGQLRGSQRRPSSTSWAEHEDDKPGGGFDAGTRLRSSCTHSSARELSSSIQNASDELY